MPRRFTPRQAAENDAFVEALRRTGNPRLAAASLPPAGARPDARVEAGVAMLRALGGVAEVEDRDGRRVIRGYGCPLASTVSRRPETCRAVESLLREIVGPELFQCCRHGERPSCCFEVTPAA